MDFCSLPSINQWVNVIVLLLSLLAGAAYSEHSSFDELKEFVTALRPLRVQQTVFGGEAKDAAKYINEWLRSG